MTMEQRGGYRAEGAAVLPERMSGVFQEVEIVSLAGGAVEYRLKLDTGVEIRMPQNCGWDQFKPGDTFMIIPLEYEQNGRTVAALCARDIIVTRDEKKITRFGISTDWITQG